MSNSITYSVNYDGSNVPTQGLVSDPFEAATMIERGYIPSNLVDFNSNHFRDATIGYILRDTTEQELVLNALCSALRSIKETNSKLNLFVEYTATIAYAWEHPQLTMDAIARIKPENATNFIWQVCQAMNKRMPGPFYQTLLVSQLNMAENNWRNEIDPRKP